MLFGEERLSFFANTHLEVVCKILKLKNCGNSGSKSHNVHYTVPRVKAKLLNHSSHRFMCCYVLKVTFAMGTLIGIGALTGLGTLIGKR